MGIAIRKAYYGGFCEVYKPKIGKGVIYDIRSLYPAIMYQNAMPVGEAY